MKNNKLYSFTKAVSRILEILMIVASILCLIGGIIVFFALSDLVLEIIRKQIISGNLTMNELGLSLSELSDMRAAGVFGCLYGLVCTALGALIFGNIYKVFKNIERDKTPFSNDNVRLIKNIGIYSITAPFVGALTSVVMALIFQNNYFKASVDVTALFMGFVVLCLSQFFAHGVELEEEVNGLL